MGERTLHLSRSVGKSVVAVARILIIARLLDPRNPLPCLQLEPVSPPIAARRCSTCSSMTTRGPLRRTPEDPYCENGKLDVAAGWNPPPPGSDPDFPGPGTCGN